VSEDRIMAMWLSYAAKDESTTLVCPCGCEAIYGPDRRLLVALYCPEHEETRFEEA
jgi:hypothetical protein